MNYYTTNLSLNPYLSSIFSGTLLILLYPFFDFSWLSWFAIVPFFIGISKVKNWKDAFLSGWLMGLIWLAGQFYWLIIFGRVPYLLFCIAYPPWLGLYGIGAYKIDKVTKGVWRIILLSGLWVAIEFLRGTGEFGLPWSGLGLAMYKNLPLIQIAEFTGIGGVSLLIVMVNAFLAEIIIKRPQKLLLFGLFLAWLIIVVFIWGGERINKFSNFKPKIKVMIVQPNIPQEIKWDPPHLPEIIDIYHNLIFKAISYKPYLIVMPETAIPSELVEGSEFMSLSTSWARYSSAYFLMGGVGYREGDFFNSLFLFTPRGRLIGEYDKIRLVHFGEYLPGRKWFEKFSIFKELLTPVSRFSSGKEVKVFNTPKLRFGTVICFESVFPNLARLISKQGGEAIVIATNDAWFYDTTAPYHHFAFSVFRAVENRRFVVRCGNTGISAFISPAGKIIAKTSLLERTLLVDEIASLSYKTFYTCFGDVFSLFWLIIVFYWLAYVELEQINEKSIS